MVWLAVSGKFHSRLVVFPSNSVDHRVYIAKALDEAQRFGTSVHGMNWTFAQDGATPHTHHLTQQWCSDHLCSFIPKNIWLPNSPDVNPLDYCIWHELVDAMRWQLGSNKEHWIHEVKRASTQLHCETLEKSCLSWWKRVWSLLDNDGAYVVWARHIRFCSMLFLNNRNKALFLSKNKWRHTQLYY